MLLTYLAMLIILYSVLKRIKGLEGLLLFVFLVIFFATLPVQGY